MTDPREVTAYHEAGHAVAALVSADRWPGYRSARTGSILGAVRVRQRSLRPSEDWVEREAIISLAGPAAEAGFTGEMDWPAAAHDYDYAFDLARGRGGDANESRPAGQAVAGQGGPPARPRRHMGSRRADRGRAGPHGRNQRPNGAAPVQPEVAREPHTGTGPTNHAFTYPLPDLTAIRAAHDRIRPFIHRTPVLTCAAIDAMAGAQVFFKCENFQKVGAFKFRGATNAVRSLPDDQAVRGVVTHSSGNHAAALALAARQRGIPAYIVMPRQRSGRQEGGRRRVRRADHLLRADPAGPRGRVRRTGPVDRRDAGPSVRRRRRHRRPGDRRAGAARRRAGPGRRPGPGRRRRATQRDADRGEGLAAGHRVIGCEPALADDAAAKPARRPNRPGPAARHHRRRPAHQPGPEDVPDHPRAGRDDRPGQKKPRSSTALRTILERMKIVVEPSAAVPLAALLNRPLRLAGPRVGIIVTGGQSGRIEYGIRGEVLRHSECSRSDGGARSQMRSGDLTFRTSRIGSRPTDRQSQCQSHLRPSGLSRSPDQSESGDLGDLEAGPVDTKTARVGTASGRCAARDPPASPRPAAPSPGPSTGRACCARPR